MKTKLATALLTTCISASAIAAEGVVNIPATKGVSETADNLEKVLSSKGMTIFNRIKHSESAKEIGIELRDTEVIIFGNPKIGSQLMKCQQSVAIDLPQKALIWEDEESNVWITYNDPGYLIDRHSIEGCDEVAETVSNALNNLTSAAAKM
jgi:uncharacterized protein (DUF302 family)